MYLTIADYLSLLGTFALIIFFIYGYFRQPTPAAKEVYVHEWAELVKQFAPGILKSLPGIKPALVPVIVRAISEAEAVAQTQGGTGQQKKDAVMDLVVSGLTAANIQAGRTVIDIDKTAAAVSIGVDAVVATVNTAQKTAAA